MGIYMSQSQDTSGSENSNIKTESKSQINVKKTDNTTFYSSISSLLLLFIIAIVFYFKK